MVRAAGGLFGGTPALAGCAGRVLLAVAGALALGRVPVTRRRDELLSCEVAGRAGLPAVGSSQSSMQRLADNGVPSIRGVGAAFLKL